MSKTCWSVFKWQSFCSSKEEYHQEQSKGQLKWSKLSSVLTRSTWRVLEVLVKKASENLQLSMSEQRRAPRLGKSKESVHNEGFKTTDPFYGTITGATPVQVPFNWDDLKHTELINWLNRIHELSHRENEQATGIDVRVQNCHSSFSSTQFIQSRMLLPLIKKSATWNKTHTHIVH